MHQHAMHLEIPMHHTCGLRLQDVQPCQQIVPELVHACGQIRPLQSLPHCRIGCLELASPSLHLASGIVSGLAKALQTCHLEVNIVHSSGCCRNGLPELLPVR